MTLVSTAPSNSEPFSSESTEIIDGKYCCGGVGVAGVVGDVGVVGVVGVVGIVGVVGTVGVVGVVGVVGIVGVAGVGAQDTSSRDSTIKQLSTDQTIFLFTVAGPSFFFRILVFTLTNVKRNDSRYVIN